MPFNRILTAVDFSPKSLEAFRVAVEMARAHSVSLHLLHVIEARPAVPVETAAEIFQKAKTAVEQLVAPHSRLSKRPHSPRRLPAGAPSMKSLAAHANGAPT